MADTCGWYNPLFKGRDRELHTNQRQPQIRKSPKLNKGADGGTGSDVKALATSPMHWPELLYIASAQAPFCANESEESRRASLLSHRSRIVTSRAAVCRGELMFSSVPRHNIARRHMKTSVLAGHKRAARSRTTTSRTWGPIGGVRLKQDHCTTFLTTKR
uniref:Uncharacterized protein n=1 Tax=Knipowitschia caucasica TaxID=637954 RepID=A0AAV2MA11_KNICA